MTQSSELKSESRLELGQQPEQSNQNGHRLRPLTNQERASIIAMLDEKLGREGYCRIKEDLLVSGMDGIFMRETGLFGQSAPDTVDSEGRSPVMIGVAEDDYGIYLVGILPIESEEDVEFELISLSSGQKCLMGPSILLRDRDEVAGRIDDIKIMYLRAELRFLLSGISAQTVFDRPRFQISPWLDLDKAREDRQKRELANRAMHDEQMRIIRESIQIKKAIQSVRVRCTWLGMVAGVVLSASGAVDVVAKKVSDKAQEVVMNNSDPEVAAPVSLMIAEGEKAFQARKKNIPLVSTMGDIAVGAVGGGVTGSILGRLLGRMMQRNHMRKVRNKEAEWSGQ